MRGALLVGLVLSVGVEAQERLPAGPAPGGPTFEVASIKRVTETRDGGGFQSPPGRFVMRNNTMAGLIRSAYESDVTELIGAPDWVERDRYDVDARAEGNPPREQITLMLRALAAERLKLAVHYEVQERPVYALVLARADGRLGPDIQRADVDCEAFRKANQSAPRDATYPRTSNGAPVCGMSMNAGGGVVINLGGQPLSVLARSLGGGAGRLVIDKTGLAGNFELTLRYDNRPSAAADPAAAPSLFTALEEQLGLKLQPERAPLRVLVVDHVEKPTED